MTENVAHAENNIEIVMNNQSIKKQHFYGKYATIP